MHADVSLNMAKIFPAKSDPLAPLRSYTDTTVPTGSGSSTSQRYSLKNT